MVFFLLFNIPAQSDKNDELSVEGSGKGNSEAKALVAAKRNAIEKATKIELKSQIEINNYRHQADLYSRFSTGVN